MKNGSKILIALGAGLVLGGLLGVLFAPAKGSETRKKIIEGSKKLAGNFKDHVKQGMQKLVNEPGNTNGEMEEA